MMKAVLESPLFGIVLSILAYEAGLWVNRKLKTPLANPLLIAVTLIVGLMMLFHIPLESYQKGGDLIALFLAPATASLALSVYNQRGILGKNLLPVIAGCAVGSAVSMGSVYALCRLFKLDEAVTASLIPKSVTTPIATEISAQHGGIVPVTVAAVIITGMIGAVLANGTTVIENAAKEPHIVDLANFLNAMGAKVSGAGTDVIKIRGVRSLHGGSYSIIPDQIETGTYMAAVAATGGDVLIQNVIPKHMDCISAKLREMGVKIAEYDDAIRVQRTGVMRRANVKTMPYPGFPTDMQPQIAVCMSLASGVSVITESIYDTRFGYCAELNRMGASIKVDTTVAIITGVEKLHGCTVRACDLRAGAAMVIAGLAADRTTTIEDIEYIERGYENLIGKLTAIGAEIRRVSVPDGTAVPAAV